MDCTPPGSSVHGISQARILEWVAISFSRGSSQPRNWTQVSHKPTVWDASNWESMKIMRESLYVSHWQVDSLGVLEMPAFNWGVQGMLGEGIHIWRRIVSSWAQRGIDLTWEAHQVQMFVSNHRCRGRKCGFLFSSNVKFLKGLESGIVQFRF